MKGPSDCSRRVALKRYIHRFRPHHGLVGSHLRIWHRILVGLPGRYDPGTNFQRRGPEVGFEDIAIDFLQARFRIPSRSATSRP